MYGFDLSSPQVAPAQALFARSLMLISCTRALHSKDVDWKQEKHLMRCNNTLEAVRQKMTVSGFDWWFTVIVDGCWAMAHLTRIY